VIKKLIVLAMFAAALIPAVQAAAPDPSAVVTTATTAFEAVATLCVAMLGFFVVFRIVKAIRK
jgi:hypothetical protein